MIYLIWLLIFWVRCGFTAVLLGLLYDFLDTYHLPHYERGDYKFFLVLFLGGPITLCWVLWIGWTDYLKPYLSGDKDDDAGYT